jgi:DNA-binding response OmpR family regulator
MSVLVIEAYEDLRSAIVDTLATWQVACDSAASEEDAIGKLRARHYDTILIAPRIPIRSDPIVRFLRDSQPGELPKVVLMTRSEEDDPGPEECRVLAKPFSNRQLRAKLSE